MQRIHRQQHFHRLPVRPSGALAALACAAALLGTPPLAADMTLDSSRSALSLISTKVLADGSSSAAERFTFTELSGRVGEEGDATVAIGLANVETGVDIRDERMGEYLFETDTYPEATITAQVPADALGEGVRRMDLAAELSLHGQTRALTIPVVVAGDGSSVTVTSSEPVLIDAADYDLVGGIGKLAELAALAHIPTMVPVSFSLTFTDADS